MLSTVPMPVATGFQQKFAELATGVRLPYVEQGDPTGVPVILLHGVTDSWRSFEPVLPYLPPSLHVYALTQRGHGEADRPSAGYTPHDFAADVAAFMDTQHLSSAVVVGHSMGSFVAQRFALDYPERTRGLVLMGSFTSCRGNAGLEEFWEQVIVPLTDPIDPEIAREFQVSTLAQPVTPEFLQMVTGESLKVPAHVWQAAFRGLLTSSHLGELSQMQVPTLIVWGDQDTFFPRHEQETLATAISHAQMRIYPGSGHAMHWEEPAQFAADLIAFIDGLVR